MKKQLYTLAIAFFALFSGTMVSSQTAMQLSGPDCNGTNHDVFADLDAGKAVILHFFMPNCLSCPPPALQIQSMANHILSMHPNTITAYAMPFNNSTTCSTAISWVTTNNLSLYVPYDSGATQVAHYGGFGMPTVVLLGGTNHRTMFSTLSFQASDTTIMRDSILTLLGLITHTQDLPASVAAIEVYPNPATETATLQVDLKESVSMIAELYDFTGRKISTQSSDEKAGMTRIQFNTTNLPAGMYWIRLDVNGKSVSRKLNITH